MGRNQINVSFEGAAPEVKELFSRKRPGDTCSLVVELKVSEVTSQGVSGTLQSVGPNGPEAEAPARQQPIAQVIQSADQEVERPGVAYMVQAAGREDRGDDEDEASLRA